MYSRVLPALLITILFLTSTSLTAQDSTSVDTLVAYYSFNGNASDSSGFGNDGEVFGASLTEDRFGRSDSAYSFNRLNDEYIKSGLNDSLLKSYTVSGWYYWNGADNAHAIGTLTDTGTNDGWLWKAKDNQVFYRHGNTLLKSNSFIAPNEWFHVTLTYNDADSIASLYIDGVKDIDGISATSQADSLIIGAIPKYLADFNWDGKIDDIRIYNFVLEDSTIWDLYTEGNWPLPEEIIPDTLVAYYPFSGNATDSSGFGNDGEVFGASLTEDRFGNPNSAYAFDGFDDYIEIQDDSVFTSSAKTIEFWFNKTNSFIEESNDFAEGLIWKSFDTGANRDFSFQIRNQYAPFDIYNAVSNGSATSVYTEISNFIGSKAWYHVVGVIDTSSNSLYINGQHIVTVEHDGEVINHGAPISIGRSSSTSLSNRYFNGKIDDIKIYNYALNDSAIIESYSKGDWPLPEEVIPDTLVAYYPFSGNVTDSSGFGNDGEVLGPTLTSDRFGRSEEAYSFDGVNDFIDIGMDNSLYGTDGFTFSVWAKGVSSEASITGLIASGRGYPYMLGIDDGDRLFLRVAQMDIPTNLFVEGVTTDIDTWHHYVGVFKSSEYIKIYKDGEEVGSLTESIPDSIDLPEANLWIGARHNSDDPHRRYYFNGDIDDVRIYSYALEDSSIWNLYTEGDWPPPPPPIDSTGTVSDTLIAYYPFDANALDLSNFDNDGVVFGAELTEDRFRRVDSAYYFDGSDYIDFGSSDTIEFAREDFSISIWVKPANSGNSQYQILRKGSDFVTYGEARWSLALDELGKIRMIFEDADQGDSTLVLSGETVLLDDKWHHIGVVFDRDSTLKVFVDNEEEISSEDIKGYSGYITNQEEFNMYAGRGNSGASQFSFVGSMDDIRIYSSALEDSEIENLYFQDGWPLTEEVIPDTLVAYYPFNGSANDSSGFGNDGQIFGASLTEDRFGRVDSAYSFDGIDDYIDSNTSFDYPERSFSLWIKANTIDTAAGGRNFLLQQNSFDLNYSLFEVFFSEGSLNFREGFSSVQTEKHLIEELKWYHLAMVRSDSVLKGYLNGVSVDSIIVEDHISKSGDANTLLVGSEYANMSFFDGVVDELKVYNYAITDSAVWSLFTEAGFPPDSLGNSTELSTYIPERFQLYQNYPNPFNPSTTIKFDLPETGLVSLKVFDITGRTIATLIDGTKTAGRYQVNFNASNLASGIYLYELRINKFSSIKKFTLIK